MHEMGAVGLDRLRPDALTINPTMNPQPNTTPGTNEATDSKKLVLADK